MRNLLALVGFFVVGFAGFGWYLGWYKFSVAPGSDGGRKIELDVKTEKVKEDVAHGFDRGKEIVGGFIKQSEAETSPTFVGPPKPANLIPSSK